MTQKLPDKYNLIGPYDPIKKTGDKLDDARYLLTPGEQFFMPWLSVPGGEAFVWPVGLEGFDINITPSLGIHKYIGQGADRFVEVEVMHRGEEHITMNGSFPGNTSVELYRRLKNLVYAPTPRDGKLLYLPHVASYIQKVAVANARFSRPEALGSGFDMTYEIEFVHVGDGPRADDPKITQPVTNPTGPPKGKTARVFIVTATINTLRKIASFKYGNASRWQSIYNLNTSYFISERIPPYAAPDARLPVGMAVNY